MNALNESYLQMKAEAFARAAQAEEIPAQLAVLQKLLQQTTNIEFCVLLCRQNNTPQLFAPPGIDPAFAAWVQHYQIKACRKDFFGEPVCVTRVAEMPQAQRAGLTYRGIDAIVCLVRAEKQMLITAENTQKPEMVTPQQRAALLSEVQSFLQQALRNSSFLQSRETVENFLAMAHELKNPLQIILSAAKTMEETAAGKPEPAMQDVVKLANHQKRNVHLLIRRIDNMMEMLRLESGAAAAAAALYRLEDILADIVREAQIYAAQDGVTLAFDNETKRTALLICNKRQLERILVNLLSNAVKACRTKQGGMVRLVLQEEKDSYLVRVEDTGCGMTPAEMAHLGEAFYRAPSSYAQEDGTGLGVYLVKKMLTGLGASLQYESKKGTGTVAILHLPRRMEAAQDARQLHAPAAEYEAGELQQLLRAEFAQPQD